MRGWGPQSSVCSSKPRETKLCSGRSRALCRDIPGTGKLEKFEKKSVQFLASKMGSAEERAEKVKSA